MSGDWKQYFELKTNDRDIDDGDVTEYYEYKDKDVKTLPFNLPMPPTDTFYRLFYDCKQLQDITPLANWDVSNVKNMSCMFYNCQLLQDITALTDWNVFNAEDICCLFSGCHRLQDITPLANWNVSNVKSMCSMFYNCQLLQDITALANWDVSKVKDMEQMFRECHQLQDITALANWDVSNVKDMSLMFYGCKQFKDITALANWDVSNVKDMYCMFDCCSHLQDITALANWDVSNVKDMYCMFDTCSQITIPENTNAVKSYLCDLPKHTYPKRDNTQLLQSLWERIKPVLKHTTKLNGYFKRYISEAPVKETIKEPDYKALSLELQKENAELKVRLAYLKEKLNNVMTQIGEIV